MILANRKQPLLQLLKSISEDQIKRMVHNIFPKHRETLLHHIAWNLHGFECVEYLGQLSKKGQFVIPFLFDDKGKTPLDISVDNKDYKQTNALIKMLSKTPMDHHSRLISHLFPKLIDMNIESLDKYFDKRRYQTGFCKEITLGRMKIGDGDDIKALPSDLVNSHTAEVKESLFHPHYREQTVMLEVLDIPLSSQKPEDHILPSKHHHHGVQHHKNEYEVKLIYSLANATNPEIFR